MAGGGKGGRETTSVEVPAWLEAAAQRNLGRADQLSQIGYTPYYGPDVAAMTPAQLDAMRNTGSAASAFGLASSDPMAGMPAPQTFAGGVQGYSSQPMYQGSLDALQAANPGQFAALMAPFINPQTGAAPAAPYGSPMPTYGGAVGGGFGGSGGASSGGGGGSGMRSVMAPPSQSGGYVSLADMLNGGGPGAAGQTFQGGGPISAGLNRAGVRPVGSGGGGSAGMGGGK